MRGPWPTGGGRGGEAVAQKKTVKKIQGNDLKIIRHRQKNFSSFIKIGHISKIKTERGIST